MSVDIDIKYKSSLWNMIEGDYCFCDSNELGNISPLFNQDDLFDNNTSCLTNVMSKNDYKSAISSGIGATTSNFRNTNKENPDKIPDTELFPFKKILMQPTNELEFQKKIIDDNLKFLVMCFFFF